MAITRTTLAAPANFSVTAVAGGSLPDATTYYVRAFAYSTTSRIDSSWTAELSATTNSGAGLNSILIDFDDVVGANRYYIAITKVSGDYNETAHHSPHTYSGLTSSTFTLTADSFGYGLWYRPDGVPNINVDGGSVGTPLTFEDIEDADVLNGWGNVFHEQVVSTVEWAKGNELSNSYVIDANLRFGEVSSTYFRQYSASISLMGTISCNSTNCMLFQLGNRAAAGRGVRWGCELTMRTLPGTSYFTAVETNLYDSVIHHASSWETGWTRTPYAQYYDHTWGRAYITIGSSAGTMRMLGCKVSGGWWIVTFAGSTTEMNWNTFVGARDGYFGRLTFKNCIFMETSSRALPLRGGTTFRGCETVYGVLRDIGWQGTSSTDPHNHLVDNIFNGVNQVAVKGDSDPYGIWYGYGDVGNNDLLFEHQFNPIFVDTAGNLISGAAVLLKDKDGANIIDDTTNASGKLTGGSRDVVRRRITCPVTSSGYPEGYLSAMIASGFYIEDVRNPHTLTVSKDGQTYLEATFDVEAKMTSYIVVNLVLPDASADIEEFEQLRLGTTLMRDLRLRAGAALEDTVDELLDLLERLRLGGSRFWRDLKVRAGTWEG